MQQAHLSAEERATNNDTWWHIHRVRELMGEIIQEFILRMNCHDLTKLEVPEVGMFMQAEKTRDLASMTYLEGDYEESRKFLAPALAHHYGNNRHHPEHFKDGIEDMSLVDIMEMLCDWKASSERHTDGNILKSIEKNTDRFHISSQLRRILENTARELE